jgi:hypothetical protein
MEGSYRWRVLRALKAARKKARSLQNLEASDRVAPDRSPADSRTTLPINNIAR